MEGTIRTFELGRARDRAAALRGDRAGRGCCDGLHRRSNRQAPDPGPDQRGRDRRARAGERPPQYLPDADLDMRGYLTMGAEDMAFMLEKVPGCYFFVGSANDEKNLNYGHHHPKFDFDEAALPRAAALMAGAVADFLK